MKKLFWIPLVVGLVVGIIVTFIQFVTPLFFKEKRILEYSISDPAAYFENGAISDLEIKINGITISSLYSNQILVSNSGQVPLIKVPVRIIISPKDSSFRILKFTIETIPKYEFGNIEKLIINDSIVLKCDLINPNDKIYINILTNEKASMELFSKSEGMILNKIEAKPKEKNGFISWISILLAVFTSFITIVTIIPSINSATKKLNKSYKELFDNLEKAENTDELVILSASYGRLDKVIDVREYLVSMIKDNSLNILVDNTIGGDPIPGTVKELRIVYSYKGKIMSQAVGEGLRLVIQEVQESGSK